MRTAFIDSISPSPIPSLGNFSVDREADMFFVCVAHSPVICRTVPRSLPAVCLSVCCRFPLPQPVALWIAHLACFAGKHVQCNAIKYSTAQHSTVQYSTVRCNTVQCNTVQYSAVRHSTVQYSTAIQHSAVQCSAVQLLITAQ